MNCLKCGKLVLKKDLFCKHCGHELNYKKNIDILQKSSSMQQVKKEESIETIIHEQSGARCWYKIKPGFLKFGRKTGKLVLSNKRILFLSTGSIITATELIGHIAGGLAGQAVGGSIAGKNLSFEALSKDGSWYITLNNIIFCKSLSNFNFPYYLAVTGNNDIGEEVNYSIVFANWLKKENWENIINNAKDHLEKTE